LLKYWQDEPADGVKEEREQQEILGAADKAARDERAFSRTIQPREVLIRLIESLRKRSALTKGPELVLDLKELFGAANTKDPRSFDNFLYAVDDGKPTSSPFQTATHYARVARAYFLYLYALGPCLPSLIHLEVASLHWANFQSPSARLHKGTEDGRFRAFKAQVGDAMTDVGNAWDIFVRRNLTFLRRFRDAMEVWKLRLDILHLCTELEKGELCPDGLGSNDLGDFKAKLVVVPDMSFSTIGVGGLRTLLYCDKGKRMTLKLAGLPNTVALEEKIANIDPRNEPTYRSMFDDIELNLAEALNFLAVLHSARHAGLTPNVP
jgi:hypothetical protein